MSITLYTAPNCLRCTIVKNFLEEQGQEYTAFDFKEDKDIFNKFYRANRPAIYRNSEGVEFPIFDDGQVIKQGTGEILAYLLSGHVLEACVTRSDLLHGWISGLNVSACPAGQEENFLTLIQALAKGGLTVQLRSDGRRSDLLASVLEQGAVARMVLDIVAPAHMYPIVAGGALEFEDLKHSIILTQGHKDHVLRIFIQPYMGADGSLTRLTLDEAGEAAQMVLDACGNRMQPIFVEASADSKLEPLEYQALLPYRSKIRRALVKAEIRKPQAN